MVTLRLATKDDLPLMMAWRSNPLIYKGFFTQKSPLVWEEHINWWKTRNSDWRTFIILYDDRPIGILNLGQLDHWSPEIGYAIGEISLWNQNIGTQAVRLGLEWLKEYGKKYCHTTILDNNLASIKLIKKAGFTKGMQARKGEHYWIKKLSS